MKKFAVFDIDGTLIRWQLYHAVANELLKQGTNTHLYNDIRVARMKWKQREHHLSFRDYEHALIAAYETTLEDLSTTDFDRAAKAVVNEYKDQVYAYTRDKISELKSQGYTLLAISGSQIELVQAIANYYGFDDCLGTVYKRAGNRFTGEKIIGSADKKNALLQLVKKYDLSLSGSVAVGDSESDIPMLELVEQPIVFNPTRKLFEHAQSAGWQVVIERKNMCYKLKAKNGSYVLAETN